MTTDPLSLAFIACFLIGFFFLVITSFMGHGASHHLGGHGHALHLGGHGGHMPHSGGFSPFAYLHPMSLALFLLGFGFCGYVLHTMVSSLALLLIFAIASVGGLMMTFAFLTLLNRIFGQSEATTVQDVSDRAGLLGKVSVAIPQHSLGEISYTSPGGLRKSIPARSLNGQRLERNQEIVVLNYRGGVAEVDTWDHFVQEQQQHS